MEINLDYSVFKEQVNSKQLLWQYVDRGADYFIFAIDGQISYYAKAIKNTDESTDFETNYKDGSNRSLEVTPTGIMSDFAGKQIVVGENDASGYCEWSYDVKVFINKIMPVVIDAVWGDKIEFEVLLKENDYVIKAYARDIFVYDDKPANVWFQGIGAGEIPSICKVRCTYTKAAGSSTARKCIIIAEFQVAP